ncbi:coiled-coil domain-containing protein 124 isoform X2 [Dromiciops gliroides]|uniref:coiled-coil domain-containing protein 124 isoform X2 n=1 Tax=Dromiciops gliroides TaxID=33562 RepID=UPI001CC4E0F8|nr:coiled-coil domain-containing protein 124 isoform X2 [Dromiciops gliroides]
MPKKFQGENTKSAAARARKAEAKAAADAKRQQELEDAYWRDDDKHVMRKEQRKLCHCSDLRSRGLSVVSIALQGNQIFISGPPQKEREEKEKRRLEQLERKKELQRLLEEEDSKLKGKSPKPLTPGKVTRAQIEETLRREQPHKENEDTDKPKSHLEVPLEENVNRRIPEEGSVEARTIEDAIAVLSVNDDSDRHPERRMKAAFTAFEELHLPRLKKENPNMRLSQLKQLLKKEWMKSPDNPMNQRTMAYNAQK